MSDIRKVMNEEIRRLAKKEVKAALAPVLSANSALRKRVAEQGKRIRQLEAMAAKAAAQKPAPAAGKAEDAKEKQIRLTPERIRKIRTKLAISQAQFAKILGVNTQSVNFWENGKTTPRPLLKKEMAAIRDMGKREIAKLFAEKEIIVKKAEKAVRSTVKAVRKAVRKVAAAAAPAAEAKKSEKAAPAAAPKKAEKKAKKAVKAAAPKKAKKTVKAAAPKKAEKKAKKAVKAVAPVSAEAKKAPEAPVAAPAAKTVQK